jgi:hypothetical protein
MGWLAVCNMLLAGSLLANFRRWRQLKGIWIIAPSTIFCLGLVLRLVIGGNIIAIMPKEWVIEGEHGQYLVTWLHMSDISRIWAIYGAVVAVSYLTLWWFIKKVRSKTNHLEYIQRRPTGWAGILTADSKRAAKEVERKRIVHLTTLLMLVFLVSAAIEIYSGATDRGADYSRWVSEDVTPLFPFKVVSRLSITGYFLIPFASEYMKRWYKLVFWASSSLWPMAGLYFGGRGQAMYPVLAVGLGVLVKNGVSKKVLVRVIASLLAMLVAVPWIAAYRDSSAYLGSDHTAVGSRLSAFTRVIVSDRLAYRIKALGREFYACSDGYLFTDENRKNTRVGLEGLDIYSLGSIIKPGLFSKKKVVKNDGAEVAQRFIGVDIAGWFPCITTPGDLLRRAGERGLILGGMAMGLVLVILDKLWKLAVTSNTSTFTLLMSCLSVSYVQLNLNGTVRDLIWTIGWDLPKYVVVALLIGFAIRMTAREEPNAGKEV